MTIRIAFTVWNGDPARPAGRVVSFTSTV